MNKLLTFFIFFSTSFCNIFCNSDGGISLCSSNNDIFFYNIFLCDNSSSSIFFCSSDNSIFLCDSVNSIFFYRSSSSVFFYKINSGGIFCKSSSSIFFCKSSDIFFYRSSSNSGVFLYNNTFFNIFFF